MVQAARRKGLTRVILASFFLSVLAGEALRADIVHLTNGGTLEGDVTYQDDRVVVTTKFGSVTVPREQVLRVEHVASPEERYQEKAKALGPDDAEGHYQLALWCQQQERLEEEAVKEAEAALAADPDHAGAHELLGHVRFRGRWLTRAERDEALAEAARPRLEAVLSACRSALTERGHEVDALLAELTPRVILNVADFAESLPSDPLSAAQAEALLTDLTVVLRLARKVSLSGLRDASHVSRARQLIVEYFRATTVAQEAKAVAALRELGDVSSEVVAVLAQEGSFYESQPSAERVRVVTVGGRRIEYVLVVPEDYDPARAYPLLLAYHGMGGTGQQFVARWRRMSLEHGYILACPTDPYGTRGYAARPEQRALVLATMEDVARTYHVDPDRVFLTGLSAGGHAAWDVGLHHADRFAGIVPQAGMPIHEGTPISRYLYLQNATAGLGVYAVVGERDEDIRQICEQATRKLEAFGVDATLVVIRGAGHSAYPSEDQHIFAWMEKHRRNPTPGMIFKRFHHLSQGRAHWVEATALTDPEWDSSKPVKLRGSYDADISRERLLELGRAQLARELPFVRASVKDNTITIGSGGVSRLTIWLSPSLVDFSRPLRIVAGKTTLWNRPVEADVGVLLGEMKRFWDLGRAYPAAVECDLRAKVARVRGREGQ